MKEQPTSDLLRKLREYAQTKAMMEDAGHWVSNCEVTYPVLLALVECAEALHYYRAECSGYEPSQGVFERKVDRALGELGLLNPYCPTCKSHVEPCDYDRAKLCPNFQRNPDAGAGNHALPGDTVASQGGSHPSLREGSTTRVKGVGEL